jgi:hypothetical protein
MTENTYVDKARVLADLRGRGLADRADWADRSLPALIDTRENAALLRMLGIDLEATAPGDLTPAR